MSIKQIEIGKAINFGWKGISKDFWYFVGIAVVFTALASPSFPVGTILGAWLTAGLVTITLSYYSKKTLPFETLFTQIKYFANMLGAQVLISLIVIGGLILLVVPGIYWAIKYQFAGFFIVDKNMSITEALHASGEMTKGLKWQLLLLDLAFLGIMILGGMALGVGILVALPIIWLADCHVYKQLS